MSRLANDEYLRKEPGKSPVITAAGYERLLPLVTSITGKVYAFTSEASPSVVSAAMARLSRRADDMRVVILDEFLGNEGAQDDLLRRVITQYGDDSVQQLNGIWLVVEGCSNLMTKMLERPRLAAYLEQSTRYIFFDQKDAEGRYRYFTPPELPLGVATVYNETMDTVFTTYSQIVRRLTEYVRERSPLASEADRQAWQATTRAEACDAARPLLPVATTSTVGLFLSAQTLEGLITRLYSEPLAEAHEIADQLLVAARAVAPAFFDRADDPRYGGAATAYRGTNRAAMRELAERLMPSETGWPDEADTVELVDWWPHEEDALLEGLIFESSNRSLDEIQRRINSLSREDKEELVRIYVGERLNRRHRPGRAIEKAHFEWEIVSDYGVFRDLQRHRMVDAIEWQRLSPNLGFAVPLLVVEAGLEAEFRSCFKASGELYEVLTSEGYDVVAQYATLLGHRMRYRFITNLREAFHLIELRSQPAGHIGYRRIAQRMYEHLKRVYPTWAAAMEFVNASEDPELGRLAAESATAFKLANLGGPGFVADES